MNLPATPTPTAIDRFAGILEALGRAVAARIAARVMSGPMIVLIWGRISRIKVRVLALAAMHRAGGAPPPRRAPRPRARRTPPVRPVLSLPSRFGWLLPLVPYEAACLAGQVRHVLDDPDMATLIAADPRVGRALRPLCWMLGMTVASVALPARAKAGDPDAAPARPVRVRVRRSRVSRGLRFGADPQVVLCAGVDVRRTAFFGSG